MAIVHTHFVAPRLAPKPDLPARIGSTLHLWRERQKARAELRQWDERDLHDAGLSQYDVQIEARKPFWRA
jgi:uncharacterized protein YjiS (DUF1127 family)